MQTTFGFASKRALHWVNKFSRNTERMRTRYNLCGRNGSASSRKRRQTGDIGRIDRDSPVKALKQITTGYRKFAEKFLQDCKRQPETQADRARKWFDVLKLRYEQHRAKNWSWRENKKYFCYFYRKIWNITLKILKFLGREHPIHPRLPFFVKFSKPRV